MNGEAFGSSKAKFGRGDNDDRYRPPSGQPVRRDSSNIEAPPELAVGIKARDSGTVILVESPRSSTHSRRDQFAALAKARCYSLRHRSSCWAPRKTDVRDVRVQDHARNWYWLAIRYVEAARWPRRGLCHEATDIRNKADRKCGPAIPASRADVQGCGDTTSRLFKR